LKIFKNLSDFHSNKKTFVTLGTFDGVHAGHQKVLKKLIKSARKSNAESVLLTFFPHPRMVLQKDVDIKLINTIDERITLLEQSGLDVLIIQKFSKKFAKKSALDFVRHILVNTLQIDKLFIGYDHHFGKNRVGNLEQLSEYSHTYNFKVKEISKKDISDIAISSTKIRKAIESGDMENANTFLGYYFMLTGTVVSGNNLGEKIGFPTANIHIPESYKLIPKPGAYIVRSKIEKDFVYGMMNIGNRPTVGGTEQTIEIHFFDFDHSLYGNKITIEVLKYLREEYRFDSINALKNQLAEDRINAQAYLNGTFFDINMSKK
jgi:riboflavin kinase/FMN adenylyltransferase